jgi:hypothetical protein
LLLLLGVSIVFRRLLFPHIFKGSWLNVAPARPKPETPAQCRQLAMQEHALNQYVIAQDEWLQSVPRHQRLLEPYINQLELKAENGGNAVYAAAYKEARSQVINEYVAQHQRMPNAMALRLGLENFLQQQLQGNQQV